MITIDLTIDIDVILIVHQMTRTNHFLQHLYLGKKLGLDLKKHIMKAQMKG